MEGLNAGIAFAAGVLSFLSPCVLPLIPSYLSFVGGTSLRELQERRSSRLLAFYNTIFFVLGFSLVFMALGTFFSVAFGALARVTRIINLAAGAIVIVLGLNFIFDFWKFLSVERRMHVSRRPASMAGSFVVGMAFGAGWAPCVGPILSSILLLAGTGQNAYQGFLLLFVYSMGLGLPFLAAGLFFARAQGIMDGLKPHLHKIKMASGLFLIGIGLLIMLGKLQQFNVVLFSASAAVSRWEGESPGLARWLFGGVLILLSGLLAAPAFREGIRQRGLRPFRLTVMAALATLGVLALFGVVDVSGLLSFWLSYQGI